MQEHYKTLGVRCVADQKEIKDQYRYLAAKYHPDKKTGNAEKFKDLSNAYTVLIDPERRKLYDETGSDMKPDEFERKASAVLQQLFQLIVSQNGLEKIIYLDIIKMINQQLDKGMIEFKKKIDTAKKSKTEIEKILKRIKHKNKNNPISFILKQEEIKHSESITQIYQEMEIGKSAQKMLKDYSFNFDAEMKVINSYFGESFKFHTPTSTGTL